MKYPDQWHNTGPRTRTDPTHPPRSPERHPEGSRHAAISRPGGCSSDGPTPATVWACGRDPDAGWPPPVVENIVTSFTNPGGHVVLLPWPIPISITPEVLGRELHGALTTVQGLNRTAQVIRLKPEPAPRPGRRPIPAPHPSAGAAAGTDLVITSLRPEHSGDQANDQVSLAAARLLRTGGVLAVLTHCDWSRGPLVDPTGAVVTAAQNADLLYLQHIVVVHTPVRDGHFMIGHETGGPGGNHAQRHGQSATHHRIHTDLLVFAQPHDHR